MIRTRIDIQDRAKKIVLCTKYHRPKIVTLDVGCFEGDLTQNYSKLINPQSTFIWVMKLITLMTHALTWHMHPSLYFLSKGWIVVKIQFL